MSLSSVLHLHETQSCSRLEKLLFYVFSTAITQQVSEFIFSVAFHINILGRDDISSCLSRHFYVASSFKILFYT